MSENFEKVQLIALMERDGTAHLVVQQPRLFLKRNKGLWVQVIVVARVYSSSIGEFQLAVGSNGSVKGDCKPKGLLQKLLQCMYQEKKTCLFIRNQYKSHKKCVGV